jgi:hypothetical protein
MSPLLWDERRSYGAARTAASAKSAGYRPITRVLRPIGASPTPSPRTGRDEVLVGHELSRGADQAARLLGREHACDRLPALRHDERLARLRHLSSARPFASNSLAVIDLDM